MINKLAKFQRCFAWLFFFLFYGELAGSIYAAGYYANERQRMAIRSRTPYVRVNDNTLLPERVLPEENAKPVVKLANNSVVEAFEQPEIGGPGQPEMSTFRSVGADNMVNLFTGDFSYNIPLLDVGGYPINIFYNAGVGMEQEASWVGLGWNINPGVVNRNMRGLPDDFNGDDEVEKVQSMKKDQTIGVSGGMAKEIFGKPIKGLSWGVTAGLFYNNRRGLGLEAGFNAQYSIQTFLSKKTQDEKTGKDTIIGSEKTTISGGINLNSQSGMTLNGGYAFTENSINKQIQQGISTSVGWSSRRGLTDINLSGEYSRYDAAKRNDVTGLGRSGIGLSFARTSHTPTIRMPIKNTNAYFSALLGKAKMGKFSSISLSGYVSTAHIAREDTIQRRKAYGYMHYEKGAGTDDALLDFNRENDGVYTHKTPVISMPVYTHDVFTISGEGTGGTFRPYRGNPGYVHDARTDNRTGSLSVTLDFGAGGLFHGGTVIGGVYSPSYASRWDRSNVLRNSIGFDGNKGAYEAVYFKNPAEKAIVDETYYNALGQDKLIRPFLTSQVASGRILANGYQVLNEARVVQPGMLEMSTNVRKEDRDKRTQVITSLTAEDASVVGLDKRIPIHLPNEFTQLCGPNQSVVNQIDRFSVTNSGYRKKHHLSEINVLEGDGKRYVYGIPVYQVSQTEAVFSLDKSTIGISGLVPLNNEEIISYQPGIDNSVTNDRARDGYFQREKTSAYAHAFLLSAILSPDYVDVKDDGITDDDLGTAIKFNYSRLALQRNAFQQTVSNTFKWRMPVEQNHARYNEGLQSDHRDDKGLYTYGEKEVWYMHSITSKNMIATFTIEDRDDGLQVIGENGGVSADAPKLQRLKRIDLYTKADFLKGNARPVKTVHFSYSYKLCKNYPLNTTNDSGKLTLDAIWFSYNGNERQVKNKYVFNYANLINEINANPDYHTGYSDRWGNYKPKQGTLSNKDYPFTLQNKDTSNAYAAAWNLTDILLPSGGMMHILYEADDYAFVQNKRASQATKIRGFGPNASAAPGNELYGPGGEYEYIFFDSPFEMQNKEEIRERYLKDMKQLLMKLHVEMPGQNIGGQRAYEPVTIYASIKDYGFATQGGVINKSRFYVEVQKISGSSPMLTTVIQFLKDYLPQRAYPGYEVNEGDKGPVELIKAIWGLMDGFVKGVVGFKGSLKATGNCKLVNLTPSYARLNNPYFAKTGGGHRVKRIIIADNWKKMTNTAGNGNPTNGMPDSYYGQEYSYTTTQELFGEKINISSGVATYEPGIGAEENPFREVMSYRHSQPLGPTDHSNIELPIGETYFPSPSVGYSKVTVHSIHRNKKLKSGIGTQVSEFYTAKDFPVINDHSSFDNHSRSHQTPGVLNQLFNFDKRDLLTLTQGILVILNDMHGKPKSQASYPENDPNTPINLTRYHYKTKVSPSGKTRLDNMLQVIEGPDGKVSQKLVGKEIEVMNDFREHMSMTYSRQLPLNLNLFKVPPPIFIGIVPTFLRNAFRDESRYRSASTVKVIHEYGILDSIDNIDKGSRVSTRNLVFDAETGDVLLSRTNNSFDKPVYQFTYPARWVHSGMAPAYKNVDVSFEHIVFRNGRLIGQPDSFMLHFESGDELYVIDASDRGVVEDDACMTAGYAPYLPKNPATRIWALEIQKDARNSEKPKEFIFIDRNGLPYNGADVKFRILRSGRRNLIGVSSGSIVSMANPVQEVTEGDTTFNQIVIDNATNVLNAGAAEFRENWRTNDRFYAKDMLLSTVRALPIHATTINAESVHTITKKRRKLIRTLYITSIEHRENEALTIFKHRNGIDYSDVESWAKFNLNTHLEGASVLDAKLVLPGHPVAHTGEFVNHVMHMPHYTATQPQGGEMIAQISRMTTPWPTTTNVWNSLVLTPFPSIPENILFSVQGPRPRYFNETFRLNATSMVQSMVNHMNDPGQVSGIRLQFRQPSETIKEGKPAWRYCFNFDDVTPSSKSVTVDRVRLDIKYIRCQDEGVLLYHGPAENLPDTTIAGHANCVSSQIETVCLSEFSNTFVNPYVQGLLGNWRGYRSYVYYGERREATITAPETKINKDGVIANFEPYWAFGGDGLTKTSSTKWVWNSEITQYNRKGAELENHDPLDRYNSGIYGYQETLPIAVANNSKLRLSAFDGFEDYNYTDDACTPICRPTQRHFNTQNAFTLLTDSAAHTGRSSIKIAANQTQNIAIDISADNTESTPDIKISIPEQEVQNVVSVTPNGNGKWKGTYYANSNYTGSSSVRLLEDAFVSIPKERLGCHPLPRFSIINPSPVGTCDQFSVKWEANLQPTVTGEYLFDVPKIDDEVKLYINNTLVLFGRHDNLTPTRTPIVLTAGTLYKIRAEYFQHLGPGNFALIWKTPNATDFTPIPLNQIYSEGQEALAANTVVTETGICRKADEIRPVNHHLVDTFNLIPGKKMVASLWVKTSEDLCGINGYQSLNLQLVNASNTVIKTFTPKERVIEGWQLFEAEFDVPVTGNTMSLRLNAPSAALYVDDIRFHPYHANMKSFVYDPVSLRLMAELDENNFATFYEYDDEGTLVRVKKETRAGIKTITETRSGIQKTIKSF